MSVAASFAYAADATIGTAYMRPSYRLARSALQTPFVANDGQWPSEVAYGATTIDGAAYVTGVGEIVYLLRSREAASSPRAQSDSPRRWSIVERFVGTRGAVVTASHRAPTGATMFRPGSSGNALPTFDDIELGEVFDGVSVTLRARNGEVEKIFTVAPGADPGVIRIGVSGASCLTLLAGGELRLATGIGPVTISTPRAWQNSGGAERPVTVAYTLDGDVYGVRPGSFDASLPLYIDPIVQSTYLGGDGEDGGSAVAVSPVTGDVYLAGFTSISSFPGTAGGAQPVSGGLQDAFVARLDSTLTHLLQATYLGGSAGDSAIAVAIEATSGDVYVLGNTFSTDFPHAAGGAQPSIGQSFGFPAGFVARFDATLTMLRQTTYLGGSNGARATALAINPTTGNVYVTGSTDSEDFPSTAGGFQPTNSHFTVAFIAQINPALTRFVQNTYLGGSASDGGGAIAIQAVTGDVYVSGAATSVDFPGTAGGAQATIGGYQDAFVSRLDGSLTHLLQSSYFGGTGNDGANAMAISAANGDVYVAGTTQSTDLPHTGGGAQVSFAGAKDVFAVRFDPTLTMIRQATYFGGSADDSATAVVLDPLTSDLFVGGSTMSADLPFTVGAAQLHLAGYGNAFVVRLRSDLTMAVRTTYLGGSTIDVGAAIALHPVNGDLYVGGTAESNDFPNTAGGAQATLASAFGNGFLARVTPLLGLLPSEPCGTDSYPFPYTDVASLTDPFCPGIMAAYVTGISKGTTPTTFSPNDDVTRLQMTTFLQRTVDQVLTRASPRTALNQLRTPQAPSATQTINVGGALFCAADGAAIWTSTGGQVVRVQANTGAISGTWTGATMSAGILVAAGKVFVTGQDFAANNNLYVIDPTQPPGAVTLAASNLGQRPRSIAFDGSRLWTANLDSVSIITPQATTPYAVTTLSTGFGFPAGVLYDGANIWVTNSNGTLLKLDSSGNILQIVAVGDVPAVPAFDGANIWVPNSGSNTITVVQASTGNVVATITDDATINVNVPMVASFDGERILVTNQLGNTVTVFKAADLSFIANVPTAPADFPYGACSDGINFWVTTNMGHLLRF